MRSVSATRASIDSTGWQAVKTSRSRSSPMGSSSASTALRLVRALVLEFAREFLVLALQQLAAAQPVDGAVLGGGHQPRARIVRHAGLGPAFERGDQRVLGEFLGQADVAHHARQPGDEPGRFDAPDRFDGAMDVGRRHGERSDHRTPRDAIPGTALFKNAMPATSHSMPAAFNTRLRS
jgi:hypothetical protein